MSTIRTDPVTGESVIVAPDRGDRPTPSSSDESLGVSSEYCPFCPGHEEATPSTIAQYPEAPESDRQPPWDVRVVPNKYPALRTDEEERDWHEGPHRASGGLGAHEVIIESGDHVVDLDALTTDEVASIVRAWRNRLGDLAGDQRLDYGLVFKNHGVAAGASLEHLHSQLMALPTVPHRVQRELDGAARYHDEHGNCVFCDILASSTAGEGRVVDGDGPVAVFAPFASRFPFELWLVPRNHRAAFERDDKTPDRAIASALRDAVARLNVALDEPAYNLVVHTAPFRSEELDHYHWHIELIPSLSHVAGFEWGAGWHINPTPPEEAAEHLRAIDPDKRRPRNS